MSIIILQKLQVVSFHFYQALIPKQILLVPNFKFDTCDYSHFPSVLLPVRDQDSLVKSLILIPSRSWKAINTFQGMTWYEVETSFEDITEQTKLIDGVNYFKKMMVLSTVSTPLFLVIRLRFIPYVGDDILEEAPGSAPQPFVDKTPFSFMVD